MASNGCFIALLIVRSHDHIPLCSFTDEHYSNPNSIRQQMRSICERMQTQAGTADRSAARGSYYQSFDSKDSIFFTFQDSGTGITVITAVNKILLRNSSDIAGTNKLACSLLDAVFFDFTQTYTSGEIHSLSVKPFQFMKFEASLQRCVGKVIEQDRTGEGKVVGGGGRRQINPHYDALRQEITDVHYVMRKNLEDLMKRGEKLETMNSYSAQLVDQSSKYYTKTVRLNRMRLLKMYGPPAVVGLIFIVFFLIYLF